MPGLNPREMNGYGGFDRTGRTRTGHTNGVDAYRDDIYREEDEDPYRRVVRGGGRGPSDRFNDQLADQNSVSDLNSSEPSFELDHLATFSAGGARKGTMHVEDGLRKLRQMESTTGIWTMRCILLVERRYVVIFDKNSGEELERFPVQYVQEPTAIFKNDRREIYNNLILFTVMDDSNRKDAQADMHIFQSVRTPAQVIVDEVVAAKKGHPRVSSGGYKIPPPPSGPAPEPPGSRNLYDFRDPIEQHREYNQFGATQYGASQFAGGGGGFIGGAQRTSIMARPSYSPYREREDFEGGSNELLERDVQLLNHCFDDVEKFVARLQQAAEAYKELERRKRERGGKGKKNVSGDGMLGHRARPPPAQDFVDIFQKFKLSFNLLAKLKAHIHDPNAPELVHFLFTPLSLIYEASRDPIHGSMNLGELAVAPVLTQDAKQLLMNCLTSKEIELWQALGKNWTTSKDEWKGYIPPYIPRFYDGWQPAPTVVDEVRPQMETAVLAHQEQIRSRAQEERARAYAADRVVPFPPEEERFRRMDDFDSPYDRNPRAPSPPQNALGNPAIAGYRENIRAQESHRRPEPSRVSPGPMSQPQMGHTDDNTAYLHELKSTGASVYEALHDRQGKNQKELTVHKGDYLQVLDSNRNWWKVRNYKGETGYCPYTILKEVSSADNGRDLAGSMVDQPGLISAGGPALPGKQASRREYKVHSPTGTSAMPPELPLRGGNPSSGDRDRDRHDRDLDTHIPTLNLQDDPDERHAFRPIEPAGYSKGVAGVRKTQPQDDVTNELRSKMGGARRGQDTYTAVDHQHDRHPASASPPSSQGGATPRYISPTSGADEVAAWIEAKGFSSRCLQTFQGYTGSELLSLHRQELEQLVGREEAARLEGQLILQKKMTGYKTQSTAQLQAMLQKRRVRAESQDENLGQPPDFRPSTPSDEQENSDSDSDDRQLADTGKTLRDLLIRQRQKIIGAQIFDQH